MKGKLTIEVQRDAMAVYAIVAPMGEDEITVERLQQELETRGVNNGIDTEAMKEIEERGCYNVRYCIAKGTKPVRGKDGYYEFLFDTKVKEYIPVIREDGTVDYSPNITLVKSGDKLAIYHAPTEGEFGYTVFNAQVAPPHAKNAERLILKGVGEWKNDYIALVDGHVTLKGRNLEVRNCLVIDGDVGYAMGRIAFNGDVHVKGDVLTGAMLDAKGSIQVDGVVEGARLTAGKDIIIKNGVHGIQKAIIKAGGSITTNFIEEAEARAEGSITVDHTINAKVHANDSVIAAGKNGQVIGGLIEAESCVDVFQIGNDVGSRTKVVVKATAEDKTDKETLIVRRRSFSGSDVVLGDQNIKEFVTGQGEFHLTDDGYDRFEIGRFNEEKMGRKHPVDQKEEEAKKPLVLIVDDDPVILKTEYSYLNGDYRVAALGRAEDALLFIQKVKPDLILLDYMMPRMNGNVLLEKIRALPDKSIANVPVFFITAVTDKQVVSQCLKLAPQGYLIKPMNREELLGVVGKFFAENKND